MTIHRAATCLALCLLGGCTAQAVSPAATAIGLAQGDVQDAIDLWGIARGMAEVAGPLLQATGHPMAAAALTGLVAAANPLVGQAQTALTSTMVDVVALEALASQIKTSADALTLTAAPAIKAISASP